MPRGHKSKRRHAPKKCQQARGDKQHGEEAQEEGPSTTEAVIADTEVEQGAAATTIGGAEEEEVEDPFFQDLAGAAYWIPPLTSLTRLPSADVLSVARSVISSVRLSDVEYESTAEISLCTECSLGEPQCPSERVQWFMLQKFHVKKLATREEIVRALHPRDRFQFPEIFRCACDHLEVIFAVEVREVETSHHSYNLISKLNLPNNGRVRPGRGYPKTGLLMKVLSVIFMRNHCVSEEDIWRFLKKMQVYPGKKHVLYGDTKKLLTQDFVRLNYLKYHQVPGSDPPCYDFLWGPQAYAEISQERILKFLTKMKKISPSDFSCLYEDSLKEDIQRLQAALAACSISTCSHSEIIQAACHSLPYHAEDA